MKIGFIGMTHLGIVSSIAAAEKNFNVICYDQDKEKINKLNKSLFEIDEPKLNYYYKKNTKKIKFTNDLKELNSTSLVYLSIDIKTNSSGKSDYTEINEIITKISKNLNKKIILIILCQIAPGFTRKIKWPKNKLFYQVETLIFGKAFERALKPERIIVGQDATKKLPIKYKKFLTQFKCPLITMNYESAELSKISINLFLISQVMTTNSIVEIAKKIGADWNSIKLALNLDKRIGKKSYLDPGLGISGGNLERDLSTMQTLAHKQRTSSILFQTFESLSKYYKDWCYREFEKIRKNNKLKIINVGVLGLAYKNNTNSIKNSPSILLIKKLLKKNIKVIVNDPILKKENISLPVTYENNPEKIIYETDAIFVMLNSKNYQKIKLKYNKINKKKYFIDPFSVIQFEKFHLITSVNIK